MRTPKCVAAPSRISTIASESIRRSSTKVALEPHVLVGRPVTRRTISASSGEHVGGACGDAVQLTDMARL